MPQPSPTPIIPLRALPVLSQSGAGQSVRKYTKVLVSLALFLVGAAIPINVVAPDSTVIGITIKQHLMVGYVLWALFWGAPAAWRLWRKFIFNQSALLIGCLPVGLAWMLTAFCLLVFGGWFYCLFGGGIYQFLKHLWSIRRTA